MCGRRVAFASPFPAQLVAHEEFLGWIFFVVVHHRAQEGRGFVEGIPCQTHAIGWGLGGVFQNDAEPRLIGAHAVRFGVLRKVADIQAEKLQPLQNGLHGQAVDFHGVAVAKPFGNFLARGFLFSDFEKFRIGAFEWQPFFEGQQRHQNFVAHFAVGQINVRVQPAVTRDAEAFLEFLGAFLT